MAKVKNWALKESYPYILFVGGIVGFLASFLLTLDKIALLKDPGHILECNINPIISCGSVMQTPQAEFFGFPNSLIGIAGFFGVAVVGAALLAGAKFKKWFWRAFLVATLLAVVFIHYLIFQTLYRINALCPYCMVVWSVMVPIFWYTYLYVAREKIIGFPKSVKKWVTLDQKYHWQVLVSWFVIILFLITNRFWYYWSTLI